MKKTTKRFLALLLAFTMVLGMGMQTFASGTDAVNSGQTQTCLLYTSRMLLVRKKHFSITVMVLDHIEH